MRPLPEDVPPNASYEISYVSKIALAIKAAQNQARYRQMGEKDLTRELKRLEREMLEAAKNLEFERAAHLRDELKTLKERLFIETA